MARIPLVDADDPSTDPRAAEMLLNIRAGRGRDNNVWRAVANHPELMDKVLQMANVAYFQNGLNPVQRELAYYASAVTNSCHY